jgi:hypothetical protein
LIHSFIHSFIYSFIWLKSVFLFDLQHLVWCLAQLTKHNRCFITICWMEKSGEEWECEL